MMRLIGAILGLPLVALMACAPAPSPQDAAFEAARLAAEQAAPAGTTVNTSETISDEQDFAAVAARETIESDRDRLQAQREQYVQIPAQPLPTRSSGSKPDIIDYALSTMNAPGQQVYPRLDVRLLSYEQACARYPSPDRAQEAFLRRGGPRIDPEGLDPDGDGFACGWDPRPFRTVLQVREPLAQP